MGFNSVPKPQIHVLIAAAGSGTRLKNESEAPKQYQLLNGKTILERSIEKFNILNEINGIYCVVNPKHKYYYRPIASRLSSIKIIAGSKSRKDSVINGIRSLDNPKSEDIVLIHDAARPLVSTSDIQTLIDSLETNRAATLATPIAQTLRRENNLNCGECVSREGLWAMQTPQAFRYADILKAHEAALPDVEYTDDTSLATAIGIDVKLVKGNNENFKITTQDDLIMAEKILHPQSVIKTGLGYDVHAFDKQSTGPVRLCGVDIDHTCALKGHSDADVGLHAITDAILGAIGEGDIGQHFPPSDNTYKDMDSAIFLKKTLKIAQSHNAAINNVDLTIICEEPKIGPHATQMRQRVASILNIPETAVNIKATTSEQLGFTGRKEGIAAQAIATVQINA